MKLGLGLYRQMLTPENFRFARQAGATHIVAHWVDYFSSGPRIPQSHSRDQGWGVIQNQGSSGAWMTSRRCARRWRPKD